jgi:hypothetical protein
MNHFFAVLPSLPTLVGVLALALLLPAAGLASDLFPKPPVPSSRTKMTRDKTGQTQTTAVGSQSNIKLGKVAKGSETTRTTTTKPPASLQ